MSKIRRRTLIVAISFTFGGLLASCRKKQAETKTVADKDAQATPAPAAPADSQNTPAPTPAPTLAIKIRAPESNVAFPAPTTQWLTSGPWNVVYSSLPTWKGNRNVRITYTALPSSTGEAPSSANGIETDRLDDLVEYQPLDSDSKKTIRGVDKGSDEGKGWAWDWRGSGLLVIASSHWEVLGHGTLKAAEGGEGSDMDWAVTYFAKTLFTPAGIDIYARPAAKVPDALLAEIKKQLKGTGDASVAALVDELFLVKHD